MGAIQTARTELASLFAALDVSVYDYLPGSADLPAVVIGLPERIQHSVTIGYWRIDLPIYVVTRSGDPLSGETDLLDLIVTVVAVLKANRSGTSFSTLKVVDTTDLYQLNVGTVDASSASINVEMMIPNPTP